MVGWYGGVGSLHNGEVCDNKREGLSRADGRLVICEGVQVRLDMHRWMGWSAFLKIAAFSGKLGIGAWV